MSTIGVPELGLLHDHTASRWLKRISEEVIQKKDIDCCGPIWTCLDYLIGLATNIDLARLAIPQEASHWPSSRSIRTAVR